MAINVTSADTAAAESLLTALVREKFPDVDLGAGSALRELVAALSPGLALITATAADFSNKRSFTTLAALTGDEADATADALAANLFVERRGATRALATARLYFTTATNVTLPAGTVFLRAGIAFRPVGGTSVILQGSAFTPILQGTQTLYYTDLQIESQTAGTGGGVAAGAFESANGVPPTFVRGETLSAATGGVTRETTAELVARIPLALTTRSLVNQRAITHSVLERFPEVSNVLVVGAGDAEMIRDIALDNNVSLRFHTGGAADVYVDTDVETVTQTITLGSEVIRSDGLVVIMRVDSGYDITGVAADQILFADGGLYLITGVNQTTREIEVYSRIPFPSVDTTSIEFTVGTTAPLYNNVGVFKGVRTNKYLNGNAFVLAGPVYRVRNIWRTRTGAVDTDLVTSGTLTRSTGASEIAAQSAEAITTFTDLAQLATGDVVEVTYDRPTGVSELHSFLTDPLNRTVCADILGRARHPVYVSATIYYQAAGTTYTSETAAAVLTAALGEANEVCEGDVVRALTGATCVKLREFGGTIIKPNGASAALTVDADTGKLVLPAGLSADVTGQTVRFIFDAVNLTLTEA